LGAPDEKKKWVPDNYSKADLPALLELTRQNYGAVDWADPGYCEWQYEKSPAGEAVVRVAREPHSRRVVGQYLVMPIWMQVDGRKTLATLSLNTLTDAEYRGRGIFTGLAELVYQDCASRAITFTYGFPNQNSYHGLMNKLRFQDLGNVPLLVYPLKWGALAKHSGKFGWLSPLAGLAGGVIAPARRVLRGKVAGDGFRIREIREFDTRFDAFWERARNRYATLVTRDSAYLNWRFIRIPIRKYTVLAAENDSGILGYLVWRRTELHGVDTGLIVDFFVDGSEAGDPAGMALAKRAIEWSESAGTAMVGTLSLTHTREFALLKRAGLWALPPKLAPRAIALGVRAHREDLANLKPIFEMRNWYVTMGDFDAV